MDLGIEGRRAAVLDERRDLPLVPAAAAGDALVAHTRLDQVACRLPLLLPRLPLLGVE